MARTHHYQLTVTWTGARDAGTATYRSYGREHEVSAAGKPDIAGSSDPTFRGDPGRWNPEELLLAALAQCHMLAYLHLCAVNGVVVTGYVDRPGGTLTEAAGGGRFTEVVLRPEVTVAEAAMAGPADALHERAKEACFIANSVNFPVRHEPSVRTGPFLSDPGGMLPG
ncbi:OsmC family protein [Plantactinospora sp. KBS50]|uniref:OsmC family protein n=1 Tax=Plantactinospora sp. KBS50 TaxID=2024580 RepID=UPI000BAB14DF|nr:OsmC family protein [Plantactinospora sp. KBS50]ASW55084.1 peroxiredoxin [Plantactinospora sp. KBS50]